MANFAVAANNENIEKANQIMEMYAQDGDKKEDTLIRIMMVAEKEAVRGTHPELEKSLRSVDETIGTLIKQINGIVAGQDSQIKELKENIEKTLEKKRKAMEDAKVKIDESQAKSDAADAAIKQAQVDVETAKNQADAEIKMVKKDAEIAIEKSNMERDEAIRERDDARTIAAEKTASNELLIRQMASLEADLQAYKILQVNYERLSADLVTLQSNLAIKERELVEQRKEADAAQKALEADFARRMETAKVQEELAIEKAVIAKERDIRTEYELQIRKIDKENAILEARIEDLIQKLEAEKKSGNENGGISETDVITHFKGE